MNPHGNMLFLHGTWIARLSRCSEMFGFFRGGSVAPTAVGELETWDIHVTAAERPWEERKSCVQAARAESPTESLEATHRQAT